MFASAWSALKETIESEQGVDPAALMVLPTWNQKLDAHAHVHAVVPDGIGLRAMGKKLAFDRAEWLESLSGQEKPTLAISTKFNARSIRVPPAPG